MATITALVVLGVWCVFVCVLCLPGSCFTIKGD